MAQIASNFNLNLRALTHCREQMGLSLDEAREETKIGTISKIESGAKRPTYKQLDKLADLYKVPRWVFIADELPSEYLYTNKPSFRRFKDSIVFKDYKVRQLITQVEQYRDLFIELHDDLEDSLPPYEPPSLSRNEKTEYIAHRVRKWLDISDDQFLKFEALKEKLQQKSIFIFLTSKYKGWSKIDQEFRGLTVSHDTIPIIIINNSDSKKAQSFTLMHELAHLLRGDSSIDGKSTEYSAIEQWCDQFAGEFLMPAKSKHWDVSDIEDLEGVKALAKKFQVSPYACLVRLRQLNKISQSQYHKLNEAREDEYLKLDQKLKLSRGGPIRNRAKEITDQFGKNFVRAVLNTWHNQDITLHKTIKLLDLKRPNQIRDLESII